MEEGGGRRPGCSLKRMRVRIVRPVVLEHGRDGVRFLEEGDEQEVPVTPFWRDLVDRGIVEVVQCALSTD